MKLQGDQPGAGGSLRCSASLACASNAFRTCTTIEHLTLPLTLNPSSRGLEPAGTPCGSPPPKPLDDGELAAVLERGRARCGCGDGVRRADGEYGGDGQVSAHGCFPLVDVRARECAASLPLRRLGAKPADTLRSQVSGQESVAANASGRGPCRDLALASQVSHLCDQYRPLVIPLQGSWHGFAKVRRPSSPDARFDG